MKRKIVREGQIHCPSTYPKKKKNYIAPYIATTNLTYVCNIFATEKHPLPGNYSNLLHLEIKMPKRCNNIILPPTSS